VHYYAFKTRMSGLFQTAFYFGYTAMFCLGLALMCGAVGHWAASGFVRTIYRCGLLGGGVLRGVCAVEGFLKGEGFGGGERLGFVVVCRHAGLGLHRDHPTRPLSLQSLIPPLNTTPPLNTAQRRQVKCD